MNITLKKSGQARTQATAVFERSHIDPIEEEVVQALGKEVKIKGFRPGSAPLEMLREQIPASRIQEEVVQRLVPDVMKEMIETHKLQPIIRPRIELQSLDPFTIQITLVEKPEVKVDVKKVEKAVKESKEAKKTKEDKGERSEDRAVLDALSLHTEVDLASELVEEEVRGMVEDHVRQLKQYGLELGQWLKQNEKTIEDFIKDMRPQAEKNLRVRFGISSLMEEWKIEVSDDEVQRGVTELLKPLKEEERAELQQIYLPGQRAYEQFKYQKKVGKVLERLRG